MKYSGIKNETHKIAPLGGGDHFLIPASFKMFFSVPGLRSFAWKGTMVVLPVTGFLYLRCEPLELTYSRFLWASSASWFPSVLYILYTYSTYLSIENHVFYVCFYKKTPTVLPTPQAFKISVSKVDTIPTSIRIVPPPATLVKVYRKEVFTWQKRKNARTA